MNPYQQYLQKRADDDSVMPYVIGAGVGAGGYHLYKQHTAEAEAAKTKAEAAAHAAATDTRLTGGAYPILDAAHESAMKKFVNPAVDQAASHVNGLVDGAIGHVMSHGVQKSVADGASYAKDLVNQHFSGSSEAPAPKAAPAQTPAPKAAPAPTPAPKAAPHVAPKATPPVASASPAGAAWAGMTHEQRKAKVDQVNARGTHAPMPPHPPEMQAIFDRVATNRKTTGPSEFDVPQAPKAPVNHFDKLKALEQKQNAPYTPTAGPRPAAPAAPRPTVAPRPAPGAHPPVQTWVNPGFAKERAAGTALHGVVGQATHAGVVAKVLEIAKHASVALFGFDQPLLFDFSNMVHVKTAHTLIERECVALVQQYQQANVLTKAAAAHQLDTLIPLNELAMEVFARAYKEAGNLDPAYQDVVHGDHAGEPGHDQLENFYERSYLTSGNQYTPHNHVREGMGVALGAAAGLGSGMAAGEALGHAASHSAAGRLVSGVLPVVGAIAGMAAGRSLAR